MEKRKTKHEAAPCALSEFRSKLTQLNKEITFTYYRFAIQIECTSDFHSICLKCVIRLHTTMIKEIIFVHSITTSTFVEHSNPK